MHSKLVVVPLERTAREISQEILFSGDVSDRVQNRVVEILDSAHEDPAVLSAKAACGSAAQAVAHLEAGAGRLNDRLHQLHREVAESAERLSSAILSDCDSPATRKAILAQGDAREFHTAIAAAYEDALTSRLPRARISALRTEGEYYRVVASYLQSALERHAEERTKALEAVVAQDGSIVADMAPGSVSAELTRIILEFRRRRDGKLAHANSEQVALEKRIDARAAAGRAL